jgi:hypothetical protein
LKYQCGISTSLLCYVFIININEAVEFFFLLDMLLHYLVSFKSDRTYVRTLELQFYKDGVVISEGSDTVHQIITNPIIIIYLLSILFFS